MANYVSSYKGLQIDQNQLLKRGWIQPGGLLLSNNASEPTTDVDISAGYCGDSTGVSVIGTTSSMTKLIDTAWDAGTGAGGLLSGSTFGANGTYHAHVMNGSSGTDIGFSESLTPTLPTGYDDYRRHVGSVVTDGSGEIVDFATVDGNTIIYGTNQNVFNGTSGIPTTRTTYDTALPNGYAVRPYIFGQVRPDTTDRQYLSLGGYINDAQAGEYTCFDNLLNTALGQFIYTSNDVPLFSNSSGQIDFRCGRSTANLFILTISGYVTNRESFS